MKAILFHGNELQTADEVADALIAYACALEANRRTDEVTIPVSRSGAVTQCLLCLGAPTVWASVAVPESDWIVVPDVERTVADLRARRERLTGE